MAKRKVQLFTDEDPYLTSFKQLMAIIKQLQNIQTVSLYFEFLEQTNSEDAYNESRRKEILISGYPRIKKFGEDFNTLAEQVLQQFKDKYAIITPMQTKVIVSLLTKHLDKIRNMLESDNLKEAIRSQFTNDVFYKKYISDEGIAVMELLPNVWKDFVPELLEEDHLFEPYQGFLFSLVDIAEYLVDQFETGFKELKKKEKADASKKHTCDLRQIISFKKWEAFIGWCDYYSKEHVFPDNETYRFITTLIPGQKYAWKPQKKQGRPEIAAFIKRLSDCNYFSNPQEDRYFIYQCFLYFFFDKRVTQREATDTSKYEKSRPNKYLSLNFFSKLV